MFREIKFRIYDVKKKNFIKPHKKLFLAFDGKIIVGNKSYETQNPFCRYVLMQYVGFKDINGKEIYEGDIVSIKFKGYYIVNFKWTTGFYLKKLPDYDKCLSLVNSYNEIRPMRIIGNIFENRDFVIKLAEKIKKEKQKRIEYVIPKECECKKTEEDDEMWYCDDGWWE
jgi:uncharacterized phage protein (TIGR01671 family)